MRKCCFPFDIPAPLPKAEHALITHVQCDLTTLMRARDSGRLFAFASKFVSHQLKPCSPSSEAACVQVYASILRRPYSAFAGGLQVIVACTVACIYARNLCVKSYSKPAHIQGLQVNYTQAVTRSLPSGSFASSSVIRKSSLLSSKNAAAFMPKRSATGSAGTAQKLQETARAKAQSVLTAPRNAMQSAKQSVSSTTNAVINQMPKPVSCWPGHCSLCMGAGQTS